MDINVLWLAGPNNTEKFTKHRNYLGGLILWAPSVYLLPGTSLEGVCPEVV